MGWSLFRPAGRPARGDAWGGLAAMLVALPASIAFGVTVYAAFGPDFAGNGALAGIIGATLMGLVASSFGGTERLVSAPCAPAAAVLSAFAYQMVHSGSDAHAVILMMILLGVLGGGFQIGLGLVGAGRLIRYIPYPVVSGYMTGVGLIIIGSQVPRLVGAPADLDWWQSLLAPARWDWRAVAIAAATVTVVLLSPRWTKRVPGTILGLAAGLMVYFALALAQGDLLHLAGNPLIVGRMSAPGDGFFSAVIGRWRDIRSLDPGHLAGLVGSAFILAALLSIDTLKTCVVLDKLTRTRHDSDRELVAQGAANFATAACGGISGAGTMGATLVALNSGAVTRAAGFMAGAFTLVAAVTLSSFVAWMPVAGLAGILVTIGVRMIDREALRYVRSRRTFLDFCVVLTVVAVAIGVGLVVASAVGVGLSMILFVREQSGGSVVRHKLELGQTSSTWHRPEREAEILAGRGSDAVIFELQGALFFGNTYGLNCEIEADVRSRRFVIIDLRRVHSVDVTAIQFFSQVRDTIQDRGARLVLCGGRGRLGNGRNLAELLAEMGLSDPGEKTVRVMPNLDSAIAWVENQILAESMVEPVVETPMRLQEMDLFADYRDDTLSDLEARMQVRTCVAGEVIYSRGDPGDELYWVRRGTVCLMSRTGSQEPKQVAGFERGDFFGGLAFLDRQTRPNDAVAMCDTEIYVLARRDFNEIALVHKKLAFNLSSAIARTLAKRLRRTEQKLAVLQS